MEVPLWWQILSGVLITAGVLGWVIALNRAAYLDSIGRRRGRR